MFKRRLFVCLTMAYCVFGSVEQQFRKANATVDICVRMTPPGCRYVPNHRKFFDFAAVAQLVLQRSVNFSFVGTRRKFFSGVMAQVRINGTPAGRFQVYNNESYLIDCPPGTMNTFYYYSITPFPGIRVTWHAPEHAGRPIHVYVTFVDFSGLMWKMKSRLHYMTVPLGDTFEDGKDVFIESGKVFSDTSSSGSLDLKDLSEKARALRMY